MPSYVVTGAARGLGFEFVRQLSSDPENVIIAIVRSKATATRLTALNSKNVHVVEADITDAKALVAAASATAKITGGSLDVLINNAAFLGTPELKSKNLADYPGDATVLVEEIDKGFKINVEGSILTINAFLPILRLGSQKKVIILSTGLGDPAFITASGFTLNPGYAISKSALTMVTVNYATLLKDEGFIFLAISPGLVNTAEKAPTPEELAEFILLIKSFQNAAPGWNGKPLTAKESVDAMLPLIFGAKKEDSGKFISHKGNQEWL